MILCHCNVITREEIVGVVEEMLAADAWQLIVPLKVYHALEKRGRCCNCFPGVIDVIVNTTTHWHQGMASPQAEVIDFVARIRAAHDEIERKRLCGQAEMMRLRRAAAGTRRGVA